MPKSSSVVSTLNASDGGATSGAGAASPSAGADSAGADSTEAASASSPATVPVEGAAADEEAAALPT